MIFTLRNALALDTISNYLHWTERIAIHRFILDKQEDLEELPIRVRQAIGLLKKHRWESPERWINGDRQLHYYDEATENYVLIHKYNHPILNELNTIK